MASKVYFLRANAAELTGARLKKFVEKCGMSSVVAKGDLTAIKIHFGEGGGVTVAPAWARIVVDEIKKAGGKPFLTDANTLYRGRRKNAVDHLILAAEHGYTLDATGAPVMIADGLKGYNYVEAPVEGTKHFKKAKIAPEVFNADAIIVLTHATGHIQFGYGGALKNLGMGSGNSGAKQMMHSDVKPKVGKAKCVGCGTCVKHCPVDAIALKDKKAEINLKLCIGCGECAAVCPVSAIEIRWGESRGCQERTCETVKGVTEAHKGKMFYINFVIRVTAECDCLKDQTHPIVADIGVLASTDPVAIDKASADLINAAPGVLKSERMKGLKKGADKFTHAYPDTDWKIQVEYGEEIGLGKAEYKIEEVK